MSTSNVWIYETVLCIMKTHLRSANYNEERYILVHSFRCFGYVLVSFVARSLWGHIVTQLTVKQRHSSYGQKVKEGMRTESGFQNLFQGQVLDDDLEISH